MGRLKTAKERHDHSGSGNNITRLNLTEEELVARISKKLQLSGGSSSSGNPGSSGSGGGRGGSRGRGGGAKKTSGDGGRECSGDVAGDECRYCGNKGNWARECRKKKRDEAGHLAQVGDGDESMLMLATAEVNASTAPSNRRPRAPRCRRAAP